MPERNFNDYKKFNDLKKAADINNGTYPFVGDAYDAEKGARGIRWRRLKYRMIFVFMRLMCITAILVAVANAVLGFFMSETAITPPYPKADIVIDIFRVGLMFTFDFNFTADVGELVDRAFDGAALGFAIGFVHSILSWIVRAIAECFRVKRFKDVRGKLDATREIIWESFVRVKDKPANVFYSDWQKNKRGNLFLTYSSLEFYDNEYQTTHRNFLLKLRDITVVESKGNRKLIVYTAKGRYLIKVPIGRAKFWKKALLHAIQLRQRVNYGR